jgi:hypothetical protein
VRLSSRFGTERAHRSRLPPVPLSRLRQAVQRAECFTQRAICQVIIDGGGDYFFTVKGNQPALKADIEQAFRPFSPLGGMVSAA